MKTRPMHKALPTAALLAFLWLSAGQPSQAQSEASREHVILPPTVAGTPLSAQIQAEASYLAARGDLVESVASARKIHAEAFAREIDNSIKYVDNYFCRRELIRQWRARENPNHLQREAQRQKVYKYRLEHQFQDVLQGDVKEMLNWLLVELSGPAVALQYVSESVSVADSESSRSIPSAETALIRFDDGRLTFSAVDPRILQSSWPFALRAPEFAPLRDEFRSARGRALQELASDDPMDYESGERLIQSVDGLLVALEDAYPLEKRRKTGHLTDYHTAKRYLRTLAVETHRAIRDVDRSINDQTVRFEDGTLMELIQHMNRTGLMFAPPAPGGDRVYRSLLTDMRNLYLDWGDSSAESDNGITIIKSSNE